MHSGTSIWRGDKGLSKYVRYNEVFFHTFYCYWGEEYPSLLKTSHLLVWPDPLRPQHSVVIFLFFLSCPLNYNAMIQKNKTLTNLRKSPVHCDCLLSWFVPSCLSFPNNSQPIEKPFLCVCLAFGLLLISKIRLKRTPAKWLVNETKTSVRWGWVTRKSLSRLLPARMLI